MDISQTKLQHLSTKHPDSQVEFLQVENLTANKKDQKLFYCSDCVDEDTDFKTSNYLRIKQIIQSGKDSILSKWPPVNDNKLLNQLLEKSQIKEERQSIAGEMERYFDSLKKDILDQIDILQKKMTQQAQELISNKTYILNQYVTISKLDELRSILENNKTNIHQKEGQYRNLLENVTNQKQSITEQLTSLLNKQIVYNLEPALQMKESILESIKSINLFESSDSQNKNETTLDVQLFSTDFRYGKSNSKVIKNAHNEYEVSIINNCHHSLNTISNIILQSDKKYIFRIQVQVNTQGEFCYIGLMQNRFIDCEWGCNNFMSCTLIQKGNSICFDKGNNRGIGKLVKGDQFVLSQENQIEMRVSIQDQILQVLDYPHYKSKLIHEQFNPNFYNQEALRLYLGMKYQNNKIILKEVLTVETFQ